MTLSLGNNQIGDQGAAYLAEGLENNMVRSFLLISLLNFYFLDTHFS
jgi:hypothetical protein